MKESVFELCIDVHMMYLLRGCVMKGEILLKKYISAALIFLLLAGFPCFNTVGVYAASESKETLEKANALKSLGLFLGDNSGFGLEKKVSGAQGAILFVRLLGMETEAKQLAVGQTLSDLPAWAGGYVAYLDKTGLLSGAGKVKFGASDDLLPNQYAAFVLKALGYDDKKGDFTWENAIEKAEEVGLLSLAKGYGLKTGGRFTRGDLADISYNALKTRMKDSDKTLIQKLVDETKSIPMQAALDSGLYTVGIAAAPGIVDVTVSTTDELIAAIGSNKRILLEPGIYDLSKAAPGIDRTDGLVGWEAVPDGKELNIQGISNLTIEGLGRDRVEIRTAPRYAYIMNFRNVSNITLRNIVAGHEPQEYMCDAGVLKFTDSSNIRISDSDLYGCGSMGLELRNVKELSFNNSIIRECSLRAIQIYDSEAIRFTGSRIINHPAYSNIILLSGSKDIVFKDCELANNNSFEWSFVESGSCLGVEFDGCYFSNNSPFYVGSKTPYFLTFWNNNPDAASKIRIRDSVFINNSCNVLADNPKGVIIENCTFKDNTFVGY
jgi:hypothetical protein